MNLLLDTHIVLWWLDDSSQLPLSARTMIEDPSHICFVSSASIWEIQIKKGLGKLTIPEEYLKVLAHQGFRELAVSWTHAAALSQLPLIHRDPFDRLLIAQALTDNLSLITLDPHIQQYDVRVVGNV